MPRDYAERARALVGTRFRAQGRGVGGLDCVGVVLATFGLPLHLVRRDYRLRKSGASATGRIWPISIPGSAGPIGS